MTVNADGKIAQPNEKYYKLKMYEKASDAGLRNGSRAKRQGNLFWRECSFPLADIFFCPTIMAFDIFGQCRPKMWNVSSDER